MAETAVDRIDLVTAVQNILKTIEREREQEIISRRFGLTSDKETLEQVGETMGITRERVRQIEKAALNRLRNGLNDGKNADFNACEKDLIKSLHEMGRAARIEEIGAKMTDKNTPRERAAIYLLAELSPKTVTIAENDKFYQGVALGDGKDEKIVKAKVEEVVAAIKNHSKPVSLDELHEITTGYEHPDEVAAIASLSKKIASLNGKWGLAKWPTVNPKNIRDKIFVVLQENGKPMHFADIAKTIKAQNFARNNVTQQAIHNELIKDSRFVLVGRGVYALDTWGFKTGTIVDIIADVLRKEAPLHREEIVKRVLKERQVREATVLLNLQNKPQFVRVAKAQYALDEDILAEQVTKKRGRKTVAA